VAADEGDLAVLGSGEEHADGDSAAAVEAEGEGVALALRRGEVEAFEGLRDRAEDGAVGSVEHRLKAVLVRGGRHGIGTRRGERALATGAQLVQLLEESGSDALRVGPGRRLSLAENVAPVAEPALEPFRAVQDLEEVEVPLVAVEKPGSEPTDAAMGRVVIPTLA